MKFSFSYKHIFFLLLIVTIGYIGLNYFNIIKEGKKQRSRNKRTKSIDTEYIVPHGSYQKPGTPTHNASTQINKNSH